MCINITHPPQSQTAWRLPESLIYPDLQRLVVCVRLECCPIPWVLEVIFFFFFYALSLLSFPRKSPQSREDDTDAPPTCNDLC